MGGMALFSVGLSESYPALRRAETSLSVRPMKIDGKEMRTIWVESDGAGIGTIDQTLLPHRFAPARLTTLDDAVRAIKTMQVRGAPLIGAAAAYGVWLALRADASDENLERPIGALQIFVGGIAAQRHPRALTRGRA